MFRFFFFFIAFPFLINSVVPNEALEEIPHISTISTEPLLKIIEEQLQAIRSNKMKQAYQDYTSSQFRKHISLEEFKKLVSGFPPLSKNKLFQFQSFYTENNIASFGGDLLSTDGESVRSEYDLVLEGGKWKIYGIQIYKTSQ